MVSRAKKTKTKNINKLTGVILATVFALGPVASAPFLQTTFAAGYNINIANSSASGLSVSLSGDASANPFVGQPNSADKVSTHNDQHISVLDWGDGTHTYDTTSTMVFTFNGGNDKSFTASWSAGHTYSTPGSKNITVAVYHSQSPGAEGSDASSTATIAVHTITSSVVGGNGTISPLGTIAVIGGSNQTFTITPNSGYHTDTLTVDRNSITPTASYTFTNVTADHTISATFASDSVPDTTPPVIAAHEDVIAEAISLGGAVVDYDSPVTADDVDGSGIATCSPVSGSVFEFGDTTVTCNAADTAGNDATPTTFTVHVVDTTPPDVTVQTPASPTQSASIEFTVTDIFPIATVECGINGADFAVCTSPFAPSLADGTYTVTVHATDVNGNTGEDTTSGFTVDSTVPSVTITEHPDVLTSDPSAHFEFIAEEGTILTCDLDGGGFTSCESPANYFELADGEHTFTVHATDDSENFGADGFVWIVDTTPPVIDELTDVNVDTDNPDGAEVSYDLPAAFDGDDDVPVECSPASGNTFPIGETDVICTATDSAGNSSETTFIVTVNLIENNGGGGEEQTDLCPNIDGNQESTSGYVVIEGSCFPDGDNDGVQDSTDNCPAVANTDQADADDDGIGDACDETPNGDPQPPQDNGGGGGGGGGGGSGDTPAPPGPIVTVSGGNPPEVLGASTVGGGSQSQGEVLGETTCSVEYIRDYLRQGKKNDPEQVRLLQEFLNKNLGLNLPLTGFFGQLTKTAVEQFQLKNKGEVLRPWVPYGLQSEDTPTGYVYKTTKRWINMLECPDLGLPIPQLP